jgi:WD40 repeat protein
LASGSDDKTVKLWSVESQKEVTTLQGHDNIIYSVAFSPDGKYLASGSQDNTVKFWSMENF